MGKLYCQSLNRLRDVGQLICLFKYSTIVAPLKASIKTVLGLSLSTDLIKVNTSLQWCKKKIRTYRVEERRKAKLQVTYFIDFENQVLGINPHTKAAKYSTAFLATKIMMAMKRPLSIFITPGCTGMTLQAQ